MNLLYCSMKIYELLKEIGTDISFDLISDILKEGKHYYSIGFVFLDNSNNLKAGWKNIDFFNHSIRSIWNLLIDDIEKDGSKFIGIVTTKYSLTWYEEFLKREGIKFSFELGKDGKIILFA